MTWTLWTLGGVALALTFANGANDNFKGVATLFGSGTTTYRRALAWATLTTAAGSVTALWLATALVARFSGRGLVPDALATDPMFLAAVGGGAAMTVLFASWLGLPISTTHALTGALLGVGMMAAGNQLRVSALGSTFVAPLLLSPFVAAVVTGGIYAIVGFAKGATGRDACLCVAETKLVEPVHPTLPIAVVASRSECASYGLVPILTTRKLLDVGHYISAGAVGFARGVNDTPKLLALLIPVQVLSPQQGAILIAATMSIGGLLGARRVAETISHRVTSMNAEQGFAANVTTAVLVLFASHVGLPVSTTHVSSGSLFGLGAITGQARWHTILQIVTAWIVTLPCAALLAGMVWWIGGR